MKDSRAWNRRIVVIACVAAVAVTAGCASVDVSPPGSSVALVYEHDVYRVDISVDTSDPQSVADGMTDLVRANGWQCLYQCNTQVALLDGREGVREVHLYIPEGYYPTLRKQMQADLGSGNVRFGAVLGSRSDLLYVRVYLKELPG